MTMNSTKTIATASSAELFLGDKWFDPLEAGVRSRIRGFIEELLEAELDAALSRGRYRRLDPMDQAGEAVVPGYRHGHRERQLTGTGFGLNKIAILANKDFMDNNPTAKAFLDSVRIPIADINAENLLIRQGQDKEADVKKHAAGWIAAHQATFDGWVQASLAAVKH